MVWFLSVMVRYLFSLNKVSDKDLVNKKRFMILRVLHLSESIQLESKLFKSLIDFRISDDWTVHRCVKIISSGFRVEMLSVRFGSVLVGVELICDLVLNFKER